MEIFDNSGTNITQTGSQINNPYGFTGRRFDKETGLWYYRNRMYSAELGRFMQRDPAGYVDGMNLYAYVRNNPLRYLDPWGLCSSNTISTAADVADWWTQQSNQTTQILDNMVGSHPNSWVVAGAVQTAMDVGSGFVDMLRFGEGAAQGGWGIGKDIIRGIGLAGSIGGTIRAVSSNIKQGIAASKSVRHGPMNPGPLDSATTATFRSSSYTAAPASESTTLYRVYGGSAKKIGQYWTRTKPSGPLQSQIDSALAPQWGNTARNSVSIRVPKGTTIYEGVAAPQSTGVGQILGGGNQVYIPRVNPKWIQ